MFHIKTYNIMKFKFINNEIFKFFFTIIPGLTILTHLVLWLWQKEIELLKFLNKDFLDPMKLYFSLGFSIIFFGFGSIITPMLSVDLYKSSNTEFHFKNFKRVILVRFILLISGIALIIYSFSYASIQTINSVKLNFWFYFDSLPLLLLIFYYFD